MRIDTLVEMWTWTELDITGAFSRYLCSNGDLDEDGNS